MLHSKHSPGCPGTRSVDQVGLEINLSLPPSRIEGAEIKGLLHQCSGGRAVSESCARQMLLRGSTPKPRPSPSLGILGDPSLQPAPSFPSCPLWPLLSCYYLKLFLFQFQHGCGSHYRERWFLSPPPPPSLTSVGGNRTRHCSGLQAWGRRMFRTRGSPQSPPGTGSWALTSEISNSAARGGKGTAGIPATFCDLRLLILCPTSAPCW